MVQIATKLSHFVSNNFNIHAPTKRELQCACYYRKKNMVTIINEMEINTKSVLVAIMVLIETKTSFDLRRLLLYCCYLVFLLLCLFLCCYR